MQFSVFVYAYNVCIRNIFRHFEGTWALVVGIVVDALRKHIDVGHWDPQRHSRTAMALPWAR